MNKPHIFNDLEEKHVFVHLHSYKKNYLHFHIFASRLENTGTGKKKNSIE